MLKYPQKKLKSGHVKHLINFVSLQQVCKRKGTQKVSNSAAEVEVRDSAFILHLPNFGMSKAMFNHYIILQFEMEINLCQKGGEKERERERETGGRENPS